MKGEEGKEAREKTREEKREERGERGEERESEHVVREMIGEVYSNAKRINTKVNTSERR